MIAKYLNCHYKSGARGEVVDGIVYQDCWGLTRAVRAEVYGRGWLPDFAQARYSRKGSVQQAYSEQSQAMRRCERTEGAVIAVLRRGVCIHVAVMVGGNQVLEIKREGNKARLTPWREFIRQYPQPMWEVAFYD